MGLVSRDDNGNGVHMKFDCLTSNYEVVSTNRWSIQRMPDAVNVTSENTDAEFLAGKPEAMNKGLRA